MATPTLRYVAPTGNEPTHLEPEPVIIHDLPAGGDTSALEARVDLMEQALTVAQGEIVALNSLVGTLTSRVEALEQA